MNYSSDAAHLGGFIFIIIVSKPFIDHVQGFDRPLLAHRGTAAANVAQPFVFIWRCRPEAC